MAELGETKTDSQSSPAISAAGIRGPLRLKIRNAGIPAASKDSKRSEEKEPTINDHQPSKKKRSSTVQKGSDFSGHRQLVAGDPAGDDSWILQRLGADAVSKRVEIFWPIDKSWYDSPLDILLIGSRLKHQHSSDFGCSQLPWKRVWAPTHPCQIHS